MIGLSRRVGVVLGLGVLVAGGAFASAMPPPVSASAADSDAQDGWTLRFEQIEQAFGEITDEGPIEMLFPLCGRERYGRHFLLHSSTAPDTQSSPHAGLASYTARCKAWRPEAALRVDSLVPRIPEHLLNDRTLGGGAQSKTVSRIQGGQKL